MPGSRAFGVGLPADCPDIGQASVATAIIACAKASGASCGRLCPDPALDRPMGVSAREHLKPIGGAVLARKGRAVLLHPFRSIPTPSCALD
jgi:hypothetical protein